MKNLGEKLKLKRESLGISLEEMSNKTKIQPHYLKALESGDISLFEEDIAYLRYFLRFYCKVVEIDFEDIKDEFSEIMGEYNQTLQLKKQNPHAEKQALIDARIKESRAKLKIEKKKIDYSLISLIMVVVLVAGILVAFMFTFGPEFLANNDNEETTPPIITPLPTDETGTTETDMDVEEDPLSKPLDVTALADGINYEIRGWTEDELISIRVEYNADTWMKVLYNDVASDNPASKIYYPGESMEVLQKATSDLKITLHFGMIKGNTIFINNEEFTLADNAKDLTRGQQIHFVLKGE